MVIIDDVLDKEELSFWLFLVRFMSVAIVCLAVLLAPFVALQFLARAPRGDVSLAMALVAGVALLMQLVLAVVGYWKVRSYLPRSVRVENQRLIVKWANHRELRLLLNECRWREGTTKDDHWRWFLKRTPAVVLVFPGPGKITVGREPKGFARWARFAEELLTRVDA